MAVKSIIDIAVNTAEFEQFKASFDAYVAKLEETPEAWERMAEAMGTAGDAGGALAGGALTAKEEIALAGAQATIVAEALREAVKAQNALGDASHATDKKMSGLAKTAKSLGEDIAGVGKWVLRLGAGALAGLGLGALVGGFGIGALSDAVFSRTRTAGGLGLTAGQLGSFQVNARQFLSTGDLQGAAAAQMDITKGGHLATLLGSNFQRAYTESAADLSFDLLRAATKKYQESPATFMAGPYGRAYAALGQDPENARRAAIQGGVAAVNAAQGGYRADVGSMSFYDSKPWIEFNKQLARAGMQIETVFVNKLGPLIPDFTRLSQIVTGAIASFISKVDLDAVKRGLDNFVTWLVDPKRKQDLAELGNNISTIAAEIGVVAEKLKWLLPDSKPKSGDYHDLIGGPKWFHDIFTGKSHPLGAAWDWAKHLTTGGLEGMRKVVAGFGQSFVAGADPAGDLANPGVAQNGLIALLYGLQKQGFKPTIGWVKSGHHDDGPLQHAGGLAADINFINGKSIDSWAGKQAAIALAGSPLVRSLGLDPWMRSQPGTMAKIVAAWVASGHDRGLLFPDSPGHIHASGYPDVVKKILNAQRKQPVKPVHVSISNSTSARVAISANGVAMG